MARSRFAVASLLLLACAPEAPGPGKLGDRCGEVVASYLGVATVGVSGGRAEPEAGKVRIDYRAVDGSGDLEGIALCHFETTSGAFALTAAVIDENRLREDEVAGFNARP